MKRFVIEFVVLICGAIIAPVAGSAQNLDINSNTMVTEAPGATTRGFVTVGVTSGTVGSLPGGTYIVPSGSAVTLNGTPTGAVADLVVARGAGSSGLVQIGGTITLANIAVAAGVGSSATVEVNGGTITSVIANSQYLIGMSGQGTFIVSNGAHVTSGLAGSTGANTFVGNNPINAFNPNIFGVLTVEGPGTTYTNNGFFIVGNGARGELNILDGAAVSSPTSSLQIGASRTGTGLVSGTGSLLAAGTFLGVGVLGPFGVGTLTITDGGTATSGSGTYLALDPGSTGTVVVSNGGSLTSPLLVVGSSGTADLQIQPNSTATISGQTIIGAVAGLGSIEVIGAGASLAVQSGNLTVGGGGDGAMTISGGGNVSVTGAGTVIAGQCNGPGLLGVFCGTPAQGGTGVVTVTDPGSVLNAGTILAIGQFGAGTLTITNSAQVSADSASIAQNAGSVGTLNIGAAAGSAPAVPGTLTTSTVTFGTGIGDIAFNHTDTSSNYVFAAAITGGSATTSSVGVYNGTTVMTGVGSNYFGLTTVHGGILAAGAANVFSPNSDYVVHTGGKLDLRGNDQTVLSLTNVGLVNMGTGTPPATVLTTTNYVGQGGTIAVNTYLGTDGSPSDTLVIDGGTATGHSSLRIINAGGPGLLTTGNGILVVDTKNGGATAADAFSLGNLEVRGGFFDYRLFRGGLNGSDPDNWFLRNTFGEGPSVTPPDVLPPEPPPTGPGTYPIIGPEIATYGAVQPMALQLGRTMFGTHDGRLSDLYVARPSGDRAGINVSQAGTDGGTFSSAMAYAAPFEASPFDALQAQAGTDPIANDGRPAVWGRLLAQQVNSRYQAFADPKVDSRITVLQTGIDLLRSDNLIVVGHRDYAGLYFAYGNTNADVSGLVTNAAATAYVRQHTGSLNLDAYSGGAYWTHYGAQGWYLDLVLQGMSYSSVASTEFARLKTSGVGFISSLEGGYPIALPQLGPDFVLEPQAQIVWQWVSFDPGNDGLGSVALGTSTVTTARVGLKGTWTITTSDGRVWLPHVRANFWRDLNATATTLFDQDMALLKLRTQYMDVATGFTTRINTHLSGFVDAGYQFSVDSGERRGIKGIAGLRYRW